MLCTSLCKNAYWNVRNVRLRRFPWTASKAVRPGSKSTGSLCDCHWIKLCQSDMSPVQMNSLRLPRVASMSLTSTTQPDCLNVGQDFGTRWSSSPANSKTEHCTNFRWASLICGNFHQRPPWQNISQSSSEIRAFNLRKEYKFSTKQTAPSRKGTPVFGSSGKGGHCLSEQTDVSATISLSQRNTPQIEEGIETYLYGLGGKTFLCLNQRHKAWKRFVTQSGHAKTYCWEWANSKWDWKMWKLLQIAERKHVNAGTASSLEDQTELGILQPKSLCVLQRAKGPEDQR